MKVCILAAGIGSRNTYSKVLPKGFLPINNQPGLTHLIDSIDDVEEIIIAVGSRGSVLEIFKNQILNNVDLTVTHKDMTRFFMDIDHAASQVLKSLEISRGGEIFIPKMNSIKMVDLINLIEPKAKIKLIGIRPGEKLHESLFSFDEARVEFDEEVFSDTEIRILRIDFISQIAN